MDSHADSQTPGIEIKCPGCGKRNQSDAPENCTRCGCDLTTLAAVIGQSGFNCRQAGAALRNGDFQEAAELALKSWELHHNATAATIGILASAAMGEFEAMQSWTASKKSCVV